MIDSTMMLAIVVALVVDLIPSLDLAKDVEGGEAKEGQEPSLEGPILLAVPSGRMALLKMHDAFADGMLPSYVLFLVHAPSHVLSFLVPLFLSFLVLAAPSRVVPFLAFHVLLFLVALSPFVHVPFVLSVPFPSPWLLVPPWRLVLLPSSDAVLRPFSFARVCSELRYPCRGSFRRTDLARTGERSTVDVPPQPLQPLLPSGDLPPSACIGDPCKWTDRGTPGLPG